MRSDAIAAFAPVAIKLLQGVVYYDDAPHWSALLAHQRALQDYFAVIGVELQVYEADGFAYLRQPEVEDDEGRVVALPRLTRRERLSYPLTALCVLLRERLDQFDAAGSESDRLILSLEEIRELIQPFLRERNDEQKLVRELRGLLGRAAELGFLRPLATHSPQDEERYEVRRILRAWIDADTLVEIKQKVHTYAATDA